MLNFCSLFKKKSGTQVFSVNLAKFVITLLYRRPPKYEEYVPFAPPSRVRWDTQKTFFHLLKTSAKCLGSMLGSSKNSTLFVEKCLYKHNTYLSSDLSKRLIWILSLSLRSAYQLCNFLLISDVLLCFYIQNFLLLKSGDIESNPGPRKS